MATKKNDGADVFAFSAFDPARMSDGYREFTEKSMAQTQEACARMKSAQQEATRRLETTFETAQAGSVELGRKAIDFMRHNTENSLSHMEALLGARSVAEIFELQSSFFRKQMELGVDQAKAMQDTSRKVAEEVGKSGKDAVEQTAAQAKAA